MTENEICEMLRRRRYELKISQRALAERTGVSKCAIALIENGKKSPTLRTLKILCEHLNLDVSVFSKLSGN